MSVLERVEQTPEVLLSLEGVMEMTDIQVLDLLEQMRWPHGKPVCPRCGEVELIRNGDQSLRGYGRLYRCLVCRKAGRHNWFTWRKWTGLDGTTIKAKHILGFLVAGPELDPETVKTVLKMTSEAYNKLSSKEITGPALGFCKGSEAPNK